MVHFMYWWNLSIFCIQNIGIYFLKQIYFWWMQKNQSNSFPICFHGNAEDMLCFQELGIDPFMNSNDNISWNRHSPAVWFRCAYGLYQSQLILADKQATDRSENARCPICDKKHRLSYFCSCLIKIITIFCKTRPFCLKREIFWLLVQYCFFSLMQEKMYIRNTVNDQSTYTVIQNSDEPCLLLKSASKLM